MNCKARSGIALGESAFDIRHGEGANPTVWTIDKSVTFTQYNWTMRATLFKATSTITSIGLMPSNLTTPTRGCYVDNVRVHLIDIEPDDTMAGVGGVVKSAKANSTVKHFVTPKKSSAYVVLKAVGVTADQITNGNANQIVQWDPAVGTAVKGEPLKWRVKRDAAIRHEVKINKKQGGAVAAQMNVWVVWADTEIVQKLKNPVFGAGTYSGAGGINPVSGWQFKFNVKPVELFSQDPSAELPKLDGAAETTPPGYDTPYFVTAHLKLHNDHGDTAPLKWDVSRQVEIQVFNNTGGTQVPVDKFVDRYSFLKPGQPDPHTTPVPYPADAAQGNDDPIKRESTPIVDEDSNPYRLIAGKDGLDHEIGEITSFDAPVFEAFVNNPVRGSTMVNLSNFREFARLEIVGENSNGSNPRTWYKISNYINWHHVWAATYGEAPPNSGNSTWKDAGSSSGNTTYTPPK